MTMDRIHPTRPEIGRMIKYSVNSSLGFPNIFDGQNQGVDRIVEGLSHTKKLGSTALVEFTLSSAFLVEF